jgi:hypothetical protein
MQPGIGQTCTTPNAVPWTEQRQDAMWREGNVDGRTNAARQSAFAASR